MDFQGHEAGIHQLKYIQCESGNFHPWFPSEIHPERCNDKTEDIAVSFLLHLAQVEKKIYSISKNNNEKNLDDF